jgi:hypothetical protein
MFPKSGQDLPHGERSAKAHQDAEEREKSNEWTLCIIFGLHNPQIVLFSQPSLVRISPNWLIGE